MNPIQSIHKYCLSCTDEPKSCNANTCPLFPFRTGKAESITKKKEYNRIREEKITPFYYEEIPDTRNKNTKPKTRKKVMNHD